MEPDFSSLFHKSSKNSAKGHPPVPLVSANWPEEWKKIHYKIYPRFKNIQLSHGDLSADFFDLIRKRSSKRDFSRTGITNTEMSSLLKYSCGEFASRENYSKRAQVSGGARFPIEVYPIVFRNGDESKGELPAGLYHYNVQKHSLEEVWKRTFSDEDIHSLFTYPWVKDATVGLVMTSQFHRTQCKYGERGYRYILLEAGHIGQNMYLTSEALGLKCCALGGTRDENLEKLIDIDGKNESVVYGLAIGR